MTPEELYGKCWDLLVEHGGASRDPREKERFVQTLLDDSRCREYRFCGSFGFGGKFRRNDGRLYVDYYPEDRTKKLDRVVEKLNRLLQDLETASPQTSRTPAR